MKLRVRVTGVLVEDGKLLILKQDLPGLLLDVVDDEPVHPFPKFLVIVVC